MMLNAPIDLQAFAQGNFIANTSIYNALHRQKKKKGKRLSRLISHRPLLNVTAGYTGAARVTRNAAGDPSPSAAARRRPGAPRPSRSPSLAACPARRSGEARPS